MTGPRGLVALITLGLAIAGLLGCSPGRQAGVASPAAVETSPLAQAELCVTSEVRLESGCKPGQRVVFMPERFGNEQLPVMFASMNCDLRYAVAMTNGGVTCIFMKARAPQAPSEAGESGVAGPAQGPSAPAGK